MKRRYRSSPLIILFFLSCATTLIAQNPKISDLVRRADTAFEDEDRKLARTLYSQVLELDPDQSHAVYRMGQLTRDDQSALRWYLRYTELEPDDAWGWAAVGDKYLRVGQPVESRKAYRRALRLAPDSEDIRQRLGKAEVRAAPVLEPVGGYAGDSDGNRIGRFGLRGDVSIPHGLRLGAQATRSDIDDEVTNAVIDEGVFQLNGTPKPTLRIQLDAGIARLAAAGSKTWTTPEATFRMRLRAKETPWALDIGVQRLPLGSTPLLVENQAMRNELRVQGTIPTGPFRIRLGGRAAEIQTDVEQNNHRIQEDAAVALPFGWRGEVSVQYHRLGFERISAAGYFAPQRVETFEGGTYWELGGNGAVSVDFDLGIGMQRLQKQTEKVGDWKPSFRGWGALNIDLSRRFRFRSEIEAYSAPFAPNGAVTTPNWRWLSVTFGILVRVL